MQCNLLHVRTIETRHNTRTMKLVISRLCKFLASALTELRRSVVQSLGCLFDYLVKQTMSLKLEMYLSWYHIDYLDIELHFSIYPWHLFLNIILLINLFHLNMVSSFWQREMIKLPKYVRDYNYVFGETLNARSKMTMWPNLYLNAIYHKLLFSTEIFGVFWGCRVISVTIIIQKNN